MGLSQLSVGLFQDMVRSQGIAVIAATHDSTLLAMADEIKEMRDGRIVDTVDQAQRFKSERF